MFSDTPKIVLGKTKQGLLRNSTHKIRSVNQYSYIRQPQGLDCRHSVQWNCVFPFVFRNKLLLPVVYGPDCGMRWPLILSLRCCFALLGLQEGEVEWQEGIDVDPDWDSDKQTNQAQLSFKSPVYCWNIFAMTIHHFYFRFLLVRFIYFFLGSHVNHFLGEWFPTILQVDHV